MRLAIIVSVVALCPWAMAEPIVPDEGTPTYECHHIKTPIVIDGSLDDPAWHHAPATGPFVFPWPEQKGKKQMTLAKLAWDDANLYVAYECRDTDITATHTQRDDPVYKDDCVELFIAPAPDKSAFYYGFEMNCRAVLYDYFYAFPTVLIAPYDTGGVWLKSTLEGTLNQSADRDRGWTLEVRIPFGNLEDLMGKDRPQAGDVWRINMNRWDGTGEARALSQWSPSGLQAPHPHRPEGFGALVFMAD